LKGIRFFERKEVKDCISLLKLTFNPNDDTSFLRIIGFLPLGIGPKTLELLVQKSREKKLSLFLTLKHFFKDKFSAKRILNKIDTLHQNRENFKYSEILENLIEGSNYIQFLENRLEQNRIFNIEELVNFIRVWEMNHPETNISALFDQMVLESDKGKERGKIPVYLLTMHNAKGTEFPLVIVSGVNSSYLPFFLRRGKSEIEEERRLFYVATTRAIKQLIISDGSNRQSQFFVGIAPSLFQTAYSMDDILYHFSSKKNKQKQIADEQFLEHPIFGKGRIVKKMEGEKYLIDFEEKGEILIDASIVDLNFL
jgi:DNA helicase-2/ATP-dependent DNA helicase PcrA